MAWKNLKNLHIIAYCSMPVEKAVCYLSKSFIAFLVPAVEILSGIEHKGFSCLYMSELPICGRQIGWKKEKTRL